MENSPAWFYLDSGAGAPAFNMALDEALLESAARLQRPVLRFYGWTTPAATFGYFQRHAEVESMTPLRPLIRRPTAGGLVPHEADWTYSLVIPPGHEWYRGTAVESYQRVHEWLQRSFKQLETTTDLALCCQPAGPGQCFVGAEKFDLLHQGQKIAGAAQRRNKLGLLIQGSVQPGKLKLGRSLWQQAVVATADPVAKWTDLQIDPQIRTRSESLANEKYSTDTYNRRR